MDLGHPSCREGTRYNPENLKSKSCIVSHPVMKNKTSKNTLHMSVGYLSLYQQFDLEKCGLYNTHTKLLKVAFFAVLALNYVEL